MASSSDVGTPTALGKLLCPHRSVTAEDGTGRAICADCGSVVAVRLTKDIFDSQMRAMLRKGK